MKEHTITVNGTVYDSRTGMPIRHAAKPRTTHHPAQHVHGQPQRSKTLNRRYVQHETKELAQEKVHATAPNSISVHRTPVAPARPLKSQHVTKFTPVASSPKPLKSNDIGPMPHKVAVNVQKKQQLQRSVHAPNVAIKPSQIIKQEAVQTALDNSVPRARKQQQHAKRQSGRRRFASFATAAFALVLLSGYLTYLNMPAISTRVAAAQSGVNASYPGYQPTGYSLNGPIAYQQGSVSMKFAANAGPHSYTLTQSDSDWDSSAVLEKSVNPNSGKNYTTTTVSGLTIYRYADVSTWVNNGILYTITGDASLSNDQVQHIATSL